MATVRDVRSLLFAVVDQSMTVAQLRGILFADYQQDRPLTPERMRALTILGPITGQSSPMQDLDRFATQDD